MQHIQICNAKFVFHPTRFFRELPPPRCRLPHSAQDSPTAEPWGGARTRPALSSVLLPTPGGGAGEPEGPLEGQQPGRHPLMGTKRWPGAPLERRPNHPSTKPQRVSGRELMCHNRCWRQKYQGQTSTFLFYICKMLFCHQKNVHLW